MAAPMIARLPPFFEMQDGMQIVLTALDPTTGATVAGVVISDVSIDVDPATPEDDGGAAETFSDPGSPFYFGDDAP